MIVSLFYSPKETTLKKKFGNLPISYYRVNVENEEELTIIEELCREYQFNLSDSDTEEEKQAVVNLNPFNNYKKIVRKPKNNNIKILDNVIVKPADAKTITPTPLHKNRVRKNPYAKPSTNKQPTTSQKNDDIIMEEEFQDDELGMESQIF